MQVIGELINGMYKNVRNAIQKQDKEAIKNLALAQVNAGANLLDVNCGPAAKEPVGAINWLIDAIREVTKVKLVIDTTNYEAMESALSKEPGSIINSTTADDEKMKRIFDLALKYKSGIIALSMDKKGIPRNKDERLEMALKIITYCGEVNFDATNLYLDPVILPVNVAQAQAKEVVEAVRDFKILSSPPPKTVVGLSNISQRTQNRSLINRIYLVMLMDAGLDAAILDPFDKDLMEAVITTELLLDKHIYCDSFLDAYKGN
ncbi:MAG: dihydropteroate synthase [Candidatus Omnitrophota bacterium]